MPNCSCLIALSVAALPLLAQVEFYEKRPTLQQTLLATRARFQQWQAAQEDARRAVKVGGWQRLKLGAQEKLDPTLPFAPGLRWTKCASAARASAATRTATRRP